MTQTIICPSCSVEIDLDKLADKKYSDLLQQQEQKLKIEQEKQKQIQEEQKRVFEKQLEEKTVEMRDKAKKFAEEQADKERKKVELEMKDMQEQLQAAEKEKQESKKLELEMLKKARELEDKEKNFELEMEKKMSDERKRIEADVTKGLEKDMLEKQNEAIKKQVEEQKKQDEETIKKIQEDFRKKELEYQKQEEQTKRALDEANRKAGQGSMQIQGDIQEDDLKQALEMAFPIDNIDDVPTGVKGADLLQNVKNNLGQSSGTIVWESKNTKSWQESWVMKLKDDKLKVGGAIAILVTTVLPKGIENFGMLDDVMICTPQFAIQVATILRERLLIIHKTETSLEGKDAKMEMLYKYLSSEEFGSKMNMMVDVFSNLKSGIDSERRAMERNWKKREKDLERATFAVTGMYGELESLMGKELPGAEKMALDSGEEEED